MQAARIRLLPCAARAARVRLAPLCTRAPVLNDAYNRPAITITMGASSSEALLLPDPFELVKAELKPLDHSLKELVGTTHPVLAKVAAHFFALAGKRFRPTVVLLAAAAANGGEPASARQTRLAEITEMIHAASLLHDDVADMADSRRAAPRVFGNKVAVLAGDFLLARSAVHLSRLEDARVVEQMSRAIEEMVAGEMMRAQAGTHEALELEHYLRKTYRKTSALLALSCKSAAMLGGHTGQVQEALAEYGRHLGIAYRLVDDLHVFRGAADANDSVGHPALAALEHGPASAPVILAAAEEPALAELAHRRFADEGDAARGAELIGASQALERTESLAVSHAREAAAALGALAPSAARDGLLRLAVDVLHRRV